MTHLGYGIDFTMTPFLVIWETTQACDLACQHCRASAQPNRRPEELSTAEGKALLGQIREMGTPIVVLSGGDPLKRPDLFELVEHGKSLGLRMATIPAATSLLTRETVQKLANAGLDQIAFSLDFPASELHDEFRGAPGAFEKTLHAIGWAREFGIPVQINTTVTSQSLPFIREMGELVKKLGIVFWEVFFLVPTGRGDSLATLDPWECEAAFVSLYEVHKTGKFILKVIEAPHYRRYAAQREKSGRELPEMLRVAEGPGASMGRSPKAVNAGRGFMFISYRGDIYPSGFLPLRAGNFRLTKIQDVYRHSTLFRDLREVSKLKGICGQCEYGEICGGSRSRAFALTGDHLESDPWCIYSLEPEPVVH